MSEAEVLGRHPTYEGLLGLDLEAGYRMQQLFENMGKADGRIHREVTALQVETIDLAFYCSVQPGRRCWSPAVTAACDFDFSVYRKGLALVPILKFLYFLAEMC